MPPRGSEGLDFTPILTHYLFLFTTILSIIAWFIAFISQAIATAQIEPNPVGVLWFAIFLQLFLIIGVVYTLATDSIAMHRFQISVFGAIAIVFAVFGVQTGVFTRVPSLDAMSAGWLILAIVDILWVLYFTSEEDSLALYVFNSLGTGGLTPPSRRRRRTTGSVHNNSNGYAANYSPGAGIGSHDMSYSGQKMGGSGIGSGLGIGNVPAARSQNSFGGVGSTEGAGNRSIGQAGSIHNVASNSGGGPGSIGGGDTNGPSSPLMGMGSPDMPAGDVYTYKAKALYAYTASPDDPNEISFSKGEILDIVDKQGKWWQAKKADGTIGIAPSNYLQII